MQSVFSITRASCGAPLGIIHASPGFRSCVSPSISNSIRPEISVPVCSCTCVCIATTDPGSKSTSTSADAKLATKEVLEKLDLLDVIRGDFHQLDAAAGSDSPAGPE